MINAFHVNSLIYMEQYILQCFPWEPAADQIACFKHFFGWFKLQIVYRNELGNPSVACLKLHLTSYHEN